MFCDVRFCVDEVLCEVLSLLDDCVNGGVDFMDVCVIESM